MCLGILILNVAENNVISPLLHKSSLQTNSPCCQSHRSAPCSFTQFLYNFCVRMWDDIWTVNLKSNQISGRTVPVLFGHIQNGWTGAIAVIRTSELELLTCVKCSVLLSVTYGSCFLPWWTVEQVKHIPTNAFLTVKYDDVRPPALFPAQHLLRHLYCILFRTKANLKSIANKSTFFSSSQSNKSRVRDKESIMAQNGA